MLMHGRLSKAPSRHVAAIVNYVLLKYFKIFYVIIIALDHIWEVLPSDLTKEIENNIFKHFATINIDNFPINNFETCDHIIVTLSISAV